MGLAAESLGTVTALTGVVLMTPEERIDAFFHGLKLTAPDQDKYKAENDGVPPTTFKLASEPFQNNHYVSFFADKPGAFVTSTIATTDLNLWEKTDIRCGKLSHVGTSSSKTYIKIDPYVPVVIDLTAGSADEKLREVVDAVGIIEFMKKVAQSKANPSKAPGGIDYTTFVQLWKTPANASFLSDRFRAACTQLESYENEGMHEWIPCTEIPETIARAADPTEWLEGEGWIDLHHQMRTSTSDLIGVPKYWEEVVDPSSGKTAYVPQGHAGAVYHTASGGKRREQSTTYGSVGPFHDALRKAVAKKGPIKTCVELIEAIFEEYIWNGTGHGNKELDDGVEIRGQRGDDIDMATLAEEQKARYGRIGAMFGKLKGSKS